MYLNKAERTYLHFNHRKFQQKMKQFATNNYHNAQVVTVELNMKMQFSTVKTISGSSMIRQHFPSQERFIVRGYFTSSHNYCWFFRKIFYKKKTETK